MGATSIAVSVEKAEALATQVKHGYEGLDGLDPKTGRYYPKQLKADRKGVITIGRGHVLSLIEKTTGKFKDGLTLEQVDALYVADSKPRQAALLKLIPLEKWSTPGQLAAGLSSFYNYEAMWAPGHSAHDAHVAGHVQECARAILLYHYSAGAPQLGLWRRRMSEALLYLTGLVLIAKTPAAEKVLENTLRQHLQFVKPTYFHF